MSEFALNIDTDGTAFEAQEGYNYPHPGALETARILRDVARRLERGEDFSRVTSLFDLNGDYVGRARLSRRARP